MPTFCIGLPEQPKRTLAAKAHFSFVGLNEVRWFDGIYGQESGLGTKHTYEVDNPGSGFNIGPHCVGIWLSHFMLWTALQYADGDKFFILEADAKFDPIWQNRMEKALRAVPADFDMLYIGSCCCGRMKRCLVRGEVWQVRYPLCLHAYVVAKKALPVILSTQRAARCYAPIDISLTFHSHSKLKVYTVLPRIVSQFDTVIPP